MRPGVRLGVDPGQVRIGVASCDPEARLAMPVETVPRGPGDLDRLAALVAERAAIEVVVGLPRSLSGTEGPAAVSAREFASSLAAAVAVPVRLVDERLTTVSAGRQLQAAGRSTRRQRGVVDQAAAVVLLQAALDSERSTGRAPGEPVGERQ
jgi:putative holliday junction resolvase